MIFLVFLITASFQIAVSQPTVTLNEVSISCPAKKDCDFIELASLSNVSAFRSSLNDYSIYGIGYNTNNMYEIDLTINLKGKKFNEDGLYTIGMINAPGISMLPSSQPSVQWKRKLLFPRSELLDMIPDANFHPRAIVIVKTTNPLTLTSAQPSIELSKNLTEVIKHQIVDALLYTTKSPGDSCKFFDNLLLNLTKVNLMVRESDEGTTIDTSISRCSSTIETFDGTMYQWTNTTLLAENDCKGFKFEYNERMQELTLDTDSLDDSIVPDCKSYFPPEEVRVLDPRMIKQAFSNLTRDSCPWITPRLFERKFDIEEKINVLSKLNSTASNDDDDLQPWESEKYFNHDWLQLIRGDPQLKKNVDVNVIDTPVVRKWFDFNYDPIDSRKSTYSCRICNGFDKFDRNRKPMLATPTLFHEDKNVNTRNIKSHATLVGHTQAITALQEGFYSIIDGKMVETAEDDQRFQATTNLMKMVYAEIMMNVPATAHPVMHQLISQYNVKIGDHHASKEAAKRITKTISDHFHDKLVD